MPRPSALLMLAQSGFALTDSLKSFLVHELSHVQGARHYHAPFEDQKYKLQRSEEIGRRDEFSVCAYLYPTSPPSIRDSDVEALRAAYSLTGDTYKSLRIYRHKALPMPYHENPNAYQPRVKSTCACTGMWCWDDDVVVLERHEEEDLRISEVSEGEEEWILVN
ncbi:hypothetical protein P171DRAFT_525575 [Karstenula rhodostoma CBS 690.94]|uniref:Uncharacterized protein n=1 Tax=Karstenula rhodostoma CBS 690.94 TaxID=1392251 RepID=A0A9P4P963_9PLEO|nr:hypothetical protein P171DRAFT_525575 [Karstenula rhodostoma CBS 690.94]